MKYEVILNGKKYEVEVEEGKATLLNESAFVPPVAAPAAPAASAPAAAPAAPAGTGEAVTAPLPGTVLDIKVQGGQAVKKGDVLEILSPHSMGEKLTVLGITGENGESKDEAVLVQEKVTVYCDKRLFMGDMLRKRI